MASLYMTVMGRSQDTTYAIVESDAYLGVESSHDWIETFTPSFIDFPFTNPDATFQDHLSVVKETRPNLAVAPDIEKDRTLADVIQKADRLLDYAENVIVVPKSVHPSRVPDRFRVGVPLANFGSGAPWGAWDYRDCQSLHLLGGGPARQVKAADSLRNIDSLDTATLGKTCRFGIWDGKSMSAPNDWDYRKRLEVSLNNYANIWI